MLYEKGRKAGEKESRAVRKEMPKHYNLWSLNPKIVNKRKINIDDKKEN